MNTEKQRKLRAAGWKIGTAREFLKLTAEEHAYVELKLRLTDGLKSRRARLGLTQEEVAERLGSSQSRVAKMEAGDRSVSLDLVIRALLTLGLSERELAKLVAGDASTRIA